MGVPKSNRIEIVSSLTDDELRQILDMERELFPENLQEDAYEKEMKEKVAILAYCPEGRVAGYIFSIPHDVAYKKLKEADPKMPILDDALYIESIAIRSDLQKMGYFGKLMKKLLEDTKGKTITMHARTKNNSSLGMKKYGAIHIHSVDDWFGTGETFDYLVIER